MCFYKNPTLVIYDLTEENKNIDLDSIVPDISFFTDYNYISTPLNIRKINYKKNIFIADKKYIFNKETYSFFNCDKINSSISNDNGYFKSNDESNSVIYYYKPIIYIRAYKNDGSKQTSLIIKVNDNEMQKNDNIYYYDCSNITVGSDLELTLDNNNVGNGYLEVI